MIKRTIIHFLAISALLFTSCGKTTYVQPSPTEIDTYISQTENIPDFDKACLMNGTFKVGMMAATVRFMLGEPKEILTVEKAWATQQEWLYKKGGKKIFTIEDNGVVGIEQDQ